MLTIGLTGGLGTGKSTVARMFQQLGAKILDADCINHRLIHRGGRCFKDVVRIFGQGILTGGDIDRRKIAAVVFNNSKKLRKLCRIVHPAIIEEIHRRISKHKKHRNTIIIIDAPLLIEAGLHHQFDLLIVVYANRKTQIRRIMRRMAIGRNEVLKRMKAQMPLKKKIKLAGMTIGNNGSLTQTQKEVKRIWQDLQKKNPKN